MAQLNSLSIGGSTVADFIVESGTDGIWDYVKYNSGRYEAWYRNDGIGTVAITEQTTSGVFLSTRNYSGFNFKLPTFTLSLTSYSGTASCNTSYSWGLMWVESLSGVDTLRVRVASVASVASATCRVSFQITGTWK